MPDNADTSNTARIHIFQTAPWHNINAYMEYCGKLPACVPKVVNGTVAGESMFYVVPKKSGRSPGSCYY